ncbi:PREDICTED: 40S ribosomal protein S27-like [Elephantulus edwardii]|uniref:40S ribosomal protein S27-like n=1 Tax=Elephantulus edwardii TaxID=28737 RepID=UPI0003F0C3A2|nr:PREDICTED: 40S ribosomal protein S27-like [Elephantulus edwardii]
MYVQVYASNLEPDLSNIENPGLVQLQKCTCGFLSHPAKFISGQLQVSFSAFLPVTSSASLPLAKDRLHPSPEEKRKHKKKHLVQSPDSYFMDAKCPGCYKITTVFSRAHTVVLCVGCSTVLCQPIGGKARLTEGCSFRWKQH